MRILHISDLHFGAQNEALQSDLKVRVGALKPHVIVATGDLADTPSPRLLSSARSFLDELSEDCVASDENCPRLLAIPGNHDVKTKGILGLHLVPYAKAFRGVATTGYWPKHKVWIYGLNSCTKGGVDANGFVGSKDLAAFAATYQQLSDKHGEQFLQAFKIALLHHHPLPVKYNSSLQRWLVLQNSGEFLGEMLKFDIGLVLHGHEHVEATCRYWRDVHGASNWELPVVSVGSTLKSGTANWFHLVTLKNDGEVRLDAYGADGAIFDREPRASSLLPSSRGRSFDQWIGSAGHICRSTTSVTILKPDGDAQRIMECEAVEIFDRSKPRAARHPITLATTSGYIDLLRLVNLGADEVPLRVTLEIDQGKSTDQEVHAAIDYGGTLGKDEKVSYAYTWWGVNAFAMDTHDFLIKYGAKPPPVEFTYYPVDSPIENLLIVVRFPTKFRPATRPQIFVAPSGDFTTIDRWQPDSEMQRALADQNAFHYIESLKTATLRVRRPRNGYSYGIQWRLSARSPVTRGSKYGQIERLCTGLLALGTTGAKGFAPVVLFLEAATDLLREKFLQGWDRPLEVSIAVLDEADKELKIAAAVRTSTNLSTETLDYSDVRFRYGEGIAGKAFKTNEYRLYVYTSAQKEREAPDFYRAGGSGVRHRVLLAMPIQNPDQPDQVYGVLSFGSESADCPLGLLESSTDAQRQNLLIFQRAINSTCYEFLTHGGV